MLQAVPSSSELEDVVDITHRMRAAVEGVVTGRPELVRVTVAHASTLPVVAGPGREPTGRRRVGGIRLRGRRPHG